MSLRLVCVAVAVTLAIAGGAQDYPAAASIRSDMGAAVQAAASAADSGLRATVQYELHPRCGPNDEVLDGLTLRAITASLQAADRSAVLDRMAQALADRGLRVERPSGGDEHLRAFPEGGSWRLAVTNGSSADELAVSASGVVDRAQDVPASRS